MPIKIKLQQQSPQLVMIREDLENLPNLSLPKAYNLRTFLPGDEKSWDRILIAAFGWPALPNGESHFSRRMRKDPAFRAERIFFICRGKHPVGTASAWHEPLMGDSVGTVHFVAVDPAEAGNKLGYLASLAVLHHFQKEKRRSARLLTDDNRIAAIKTYLSLGFCPQITHANQPARWRKIFRFLEQPALLKKYSRHLSANPSHIPIAPATLLQETNYGYTERKSFNDGRKNKGGPRGGGDPDFLGDESLYLSSNIGEAIIEPTSVEAGSAIRKPPRFIFVVGKNGLPEGTRVDWFIRGQAPLGFHGQSVDPKAPNFLAIESPASVKCIAGKGDSWISFLVANGKLKEGDMVCLKLQNFRNQKWNSVAAKRKFYVVIKIHPDEPQRRLPTPVSIDFIPGKANKLEIFLPCTRKPKSTVSATVTERDKNDNILSEATNHLHLSSLNQRQSAFLVDGRARTGFYTLNEPVALRVRAESEQPPLAAISNPCVEMNDWQLYVGDLHCHDFLSESEGYPDDVFCFARDEKRLDFLSLAVQSHGWHSNEKHVLHKYMHERFNDDGKFVALLAFEWQHSEFGDKVIHYLNNDQPFLPVEDPRFQHPAGLYEALGATDAFIISHHPGYPLPGWVPGTKWSVVNNRIERCVELWSNHGSSEGYDPKDRPLKRSDISHTAYAALRSGLRLGFVGGSDSHSGRPGGSAREPGGYWGGLAAVWAPNLSKKSIFQSLFNRHTYALTRARIVLRMTVNEVLMGGETAFSKFVHIKIDVWAPGKIQQIQILKDTIRWKTFPSGKDEFHLEIEDQIEKPTFYHCRVVQTDGELAVGSPVWIG